ncbi:type II toxin-antitoxin system HicB family antitoxin [Phormidesmis sp. 146-35]
MLTYRNYTASLWVDEKAGLICGKVTNISRDSLPFGGKTVEEAEQEFRKTIDTYLTFCEQENIEPEKPVTFSGKLPFRTSSEIHRDISHQAKQAGKSINTWLEEAAIKALGESASEAPPESRLPELLQQLEKQPELMERFFEKITPYLKNRGPVGTIKFLGAVEQVLPSLETVRSHLKAPNPEVMADIINAIETWTLEAEITDSGQPAPKPFVKEEQKPGHYVVRK